MKTDVSAMIDNELDRSSQHAVLIRMRGEKELRGSWDEYLLIGDVLRRSPSLTTNLTRSVMDALRDEPAILVVPRRPAPRLLRSMTALAASVAGVVVVGWLALSSPASQTSVALSAKTPGSHVAAQPVRMQEYLMAHQAYSPSSRIQGGASYIRTVSSRR